MRETVLRALVLSVILVSIVGFSEKASGYEFSMTGIMTWKITFLTLNSVRRAFSVHSTQTLAALDPMDTGGVLEAPPR